MLLDMLPTSRQLMILCDCLRVIDYTTRKRGEWGIEATTYDWKKEAWKKSQPDTMTDLRLFASYVFISRGAGPSSPVFWHYKDDGIWSLRKLRARLKHPAWS